MLKEDAEISMKISNEKCKSYTKCVPVANSFFGLVADFLLEKLAIESQRQYRSYIWSSRISATSS